jgi:hypothetical protein
LYLRRHDSVIRFGFRRGAIVTSKRDSADRIESVLCEVADSIGDWSVRFDRDTGLCPPGFLPSFDVGAWARKRIAGELCPEAVEGLVLRWAGARFFGDGLHGATFEELVTQSGEDPANVARRLFPLVTLELLRIDTSPADSDRLRKLYRARARALHPDVHPEADIKMRSEQLAALGRAFRELLSGHHEGLAGSAKIRVPLFVDDGGFDARAAPLENGFVEDFAKHRVDKDGDAAAQTLEG